MTNTTLFWQAALAVLVAVVLLAFIGIVGDLWRQWWRQELVPWLDRRAKSKRLIDDAMRHQHQKMLHQAVRRLVEEDRQRQPAVIAKLEEQR